MTVDRIVHYESYEYYYAPGLKRWKKDGVEINLQEGDDPKEAQRKAAEMVEGFQKENNPGLTVEINLDAIPTKKVEPQEARIGLLIQDIESCKDLKTLESYKFLVKGKPDFQKAYDSKLKELQ